MHTQRPELGSAPQRPPKAPPPRRREKGTQIRFKQMQTNPIQIQFNSIQFNSVQRKCNSIQAQFKSNSNSIQLKFNSNTISWNRPNQSNPVHLELDETRCLFEPSGSGGCSPHSERCVRTRKAAQKLSSSGEGGALGDHTSPSSGKTRSELVSRLKTVTVRPSQGQEPRRSGKARPRSRPARPRPR